MIGCSDNVFKNKDETKNNELGKINKTKIEITVKTMCCSLNSVRLIWESKKSMEKKEKNREGKYLKIVQYKKMRIT